jgi:hypothetical protein
MHAFCGQTASVPGTRRDEPATPNNLIDDKQTPETGSSATMTLFLLSSITIADQPINCRAKACKAQSVHLMTPGRHENSICIL